MKKKLITTLFILFIAAAIVNGQHLSVDKWKEDITFLEKKLFVRHINPVHTISAKELHAKFKTLNTNLSKYTTEDIVINLSEIMASVNDAHTWIDIRDNKLVSLHYLPITLELFEDGLFVINASDKFKEAVGRQIITINGFSINDIAKKVGLIGYRENEYTTRFSVPRFLPIVEVLKYYGFVNHNNISIELDGGTKIQFSPESYQMQPVKYDYIEESNPLYLKNRNKTFWLTELQNKDILYVQINQCQDDAKMSLTNFADSILKKIQGNQYKSVLIDLRNNYGGNSKLMFPFIYTLQTFNKTNPLGNLFVAISRNTLSASVVFCDEIQKYCNAYFIGEPSGAHPNLYGENSYKIVLPNSKIEASYSSEYFQAAGPFNRNEFVATDIYLPIFSYDFISKKDPVLDFVLKADDTILNLEKYFQKMITEKKYTSAISFIKEKMTLPETKYKDIERTLRRAADKLADDSTTEKFAKQLYILNLEIYPNRTLPSIALGEYYNSKKSREKALLYYEQSKELLKTDQYIYSAYRHRLEDIVEKAIKEIKR